MFNKYKKLYWGAKEEIAKLVRKTAKDEKKIEELINDKYSLECQLSEAKTTTLKQKDELEILKKSVKEKDALIEKQTTKITDLETKLKNARGHLKKKVKEHA